MMPMTPRVGLVAPWLYNCDFYGRLWERRRVKQIFDPCDFGIPYTSTLSRLKIGWSCWRFKPWGREVFPYRWDLIEKLMGSFELSVEQYLDGDRDIHESWPLTKSNAYQEPDENCYRLVLARSGIDGSYVGSIENAWWWFRQGIIPQSFDEFEMDSGEQRASIGFCPRRNVWVADGGRGAAMFGIGSTVRRGDVAYMPAREEDFIASVLDFWEVKSMRSFWYNVEVLESGVRVLQLDWLHQDGTPGGANCEIPAEFGRGEWRASCLEDARQMAIDFVHNLG